ncbi:unnamed protein product, partial [Didymodactylos carnosus]
HLTQNKSANDIKKIVKIFQNEKLSNILTKCESFLQDKDEKGIAEISECLRQCILDTTEDYMSSLLAFRRTALIAFNHFEQDFYQLLTTYESIKNEQLRSELGHSLKQQLERLSDYSNNQYDAYLSIYKNIVENLLSHGYECARAIKD